MWRPLGDDYPGSVKAGTNSESDTDSARAGVVQEGGEEIASEVGGESVPLEELYNEAIQERWDAESESDTTVEGEVTVDNTADQVVAERHDIEIEQEDPLGDAH